MQINAAPKEDLGAFLNAAQNKKALSLQLEQEHLNRFTVAVPLQATTDAAGRFRLTGVGRNRLVRAQLDGPTIASQQLCILTRPGEPIRVTEFEGDPEINDSRTVTTYHGSSFRLAVPPTKPIVGTVRDKDTGKPLAGVTIQSWGLRTGPSSFRSVDHVRTTSNADGRYRLTGLPKGEGYRIIAIPSEKEPYVLRTVDVPDTPGLDPTTVDFELKRGVWIEGKLTDKVTGKPVQGAVTYFALYSNPHLQDYAGFEGHCDEAMGTGTKEDGSYRLVGLPGPGMVVVWGPNEYLRVTERGDEYGLKGKAPSTAPFQLFPLSNYSAFARLDPPRGVEAEKRDVILDPGWTFPGTVLGPGGELLVGARAFGLGSWDHWNHPKELSGAEFTVGAFNPRRPRDLLFQHLGKGLVGVAQPPEQDGRRVTVRMEPGAMVTGRLVDAEGRPRVGVELQLEIRCRVRSEWQRFSPEPIRADREGRFRIQPLPLGYQYRLSDGKGKVTFDVADRPGETRDLGDVRMQAK
jgi:hypothetical protein